MLVPLEPRYPKKTKIARAGIAPGFSFILDIYSEKEV
jgi:hypothetical protein